MADTRWLSFYNTNTNTLSVKYLQAALFTELRQFMSQHKEIINLKISWSHLDHSMLQSLSQLTSLRSLELSRCFIDAKGAAILGSHPTLLSLDLSDNRIEDEGAIALASHPTLTKLNVYNNGIGDKGIAALARNVHLQELNIGKNNYSDHGAIDLAKSNRSLKSINIDHSDSFGTHGAKALTAMDLSIFSAKPHWKGDTNQVIYKEENPVARASFGLETGVSTALASLTKQAGFFVKKHLLPDDLIEFIKQSRI